MTIDVRTRTNDDIRSISPEAFFTRELPRRLEKTGPLAARAAAHLGLGALTLRVGGGIFTLKPLSDTIAITHGDSSSANVSIELSGPAFSDWVQEVRSMLALLVAEDVEVRDGEANAALGWDSVLRAMVDGRAVYEPGSVTLTNPDGSPLDINRSFTPDADDAEMARFLEQAGFLVLRRWMDPDVVDTIYGDIDRGLASARRGDPHRWWARLQNGDETCVRLKRFCQISETGRLAAESDPFKRICNLTGAAFAFPPSCIEALIKPTGVQAGPSEIRWHKDCWQGRHPFFCNAITIGILVTPSNEHTGCFRAMAGSHRANFPAIDRDIDAIDLPVRSLYGEPGDLTVHLSCIMHETVPPQQGERRLMYAGFSLLDRESGEGVDNRYSIKHAAWSNAVSSAWDVYA
jgi:hypothetical protein